MSLSTQDPLLWMQEYALATRHVDLVDVFFDRLLLHESQLSQSQSQTESQKGWFLCWRCSNLKNVICIDAF